MNCPWTSMKSHQPSTNQQGTRRDRKLPHGSPRQCQGNLCELPRRISPWLSPWETIKVAIDGSRKITMVNKKPKYQDLYGDWDYIYIIFRIIIFIYIYTKSIITQPIIYIYCDSIWDYIYIFIGWSSFIILQTKYTCLWLNRTYYPIYG